MITLDSIEEYKKKIIKLFDGMTMILYGSTTFGVISSDLDICFVREKNLSKKDFENLVNLTRQFHIDNKLKIDEEVPYRNKLIYTNSFIENTLQSLPFPFIDGKFIIPPISKSNEYLNSEEIRKRLLLNILTMKHSILYGNDSLMQKYTDLAWEQILKVVISYSEIKDFSLNELLSCLYTNPYNNQSGELYLGYKTNLPEKIIYLENQVDFYINKLVNEEKVVKTLKKTYVPTKKWLSSCS